MESGVCQSDFPGPEICWQELYPVLQSLSRHLVFATTVPAWRGQEYDVAEDIVQETVRRIMEYGQKVAQGEAPPIRSMEAFMVVVAQNKWRDFRRRAQRMVRLTPEELSAACHKNGSEQQLPFELALDNVEHEWAFQIIARLAARFPARQKLALLTDLANRMHFGEEPTPLQAAFLATGIQLREYQRPLPDDPLARMRHNALVCIAYKRMARLYRAECAR